MKRLLVLFTLLVSVASIYAQESGSRIYVARSNNGMAFDNFLATEIVKQRLPLTVVNDKSKADYELTWSVIPEEEKTHGNGSALFPFGSKTLYSVSATLVSSDSITVWASNADKKKLPDAAKIIVQQLGKNFKLKK